MNSFDPSDSLEWSLVVATYNRGDILPRCVRLAVTQTRPPCEVIVVDGSEDWEVTRRSVLEEIATLAPNVVVVYDRAVTLSSSTQRNQGVARATGDVVFCLDDDALMYPNCAEETMRIYEADPDHLVAGVSTVLTERPPDVDTGANGASRGVVPNARAGWLRRSVRRWLNADEIFIPYDESFPEHSLPNNLTRLAVGQVRVMHGCSSFRREALLREPYDDIMVRYAAGEDSDASYRVSRHGALVCAHHARVCHLETPSNRLSPYVKTALGAMNPAVLHRLHSSDIQRSRRRYRRLLSRRLVIATLKDLCERRLSLPNARGIWFARRHCDEAMARDELSLRAWYPGFQERLLEADALRARS